MFHTFQNQTQAFFIISSDNMTIQAQKNLALRDNIYQAIPTFKKPLSTSSISLANSKDHYSKLVNFSINAYKRDKKYNKRFSRYKH